ncbi:unnamed protein product [Cylicocyclus nassatus]|uniref:GRAM domain-containing protein n=1 Tax=Cylicocyclus nassatus TaxID=53992 RepID=A0AA36H298_CYLNA|nr:unnamed protein product [Cylicocyclus nassatus]
MSSFVLHPLFIAQHQMTSLLDVPGMGLRRRSEGCLVEPFRSNSICEANGGIGIQKQEKSSSQLTVRNGVEGNLLEVLRKNYDIVTALADIDSSEFGHRSRSRQMRGPASRIASPSPKPLVVRPNTLYTKGCFEFENSSLSSSDTEIEPTESVWSRLRSEAKDFLHDIADAFETQNEEQKQTTPDSQKLSAIALRRDLKRCYSFLHPLVEVGAALYDTLLWKNPINTLLLALVYSYSIVRGWTASLVLLLLWTQLSLNYLKATKNIDIGLNFLPRKEVAMPKFDISGAQLIFDVAKIVQNLLNFAANLLEKIHSLVTWKDVRVTFVFYCLVIYWLVLSMVFNTGTCLGMCGLTLGVRIFITTYLFHRFPRLRKRLDTYGWFYRNLPMKTDRDLVSASSTDGNLAANKTDTKIHTPLSRRAAIPSGMFTSRLGSNFNLLDTGSQQNLLSHQKPRSMLDIDKIAKKGSAPNLRAMCKESRDCYSERSSPVMRPKNHWNTNGNEESFDPVVLPVPSQPRIVKSPLALVHSAPAPPPQDPPPRERTSPEKDEEDDLTESSSQLSFCSNADDDSIQDDPLLDNVLAYRSCVMNDKERSFPKAISSGILYLTENALVYRSKSTADDRAPTIMLFTDITSIKKIQSLRTISLLAGTRKALEIEMEGRRKPLQFIGLAQRDDFFERIESVCTRSDAHIDFS